MNPYLKKQLSREVDSITIIAGNNLIKLSGLWEISSSGHSSDYGRVNYNYLVNIHDSNYAIHPDDIPIIKKITGNLRSQTKAEFKVRLFTHEGEIKQLNGHGTIADPLEKNGSADLALKPFMQEPTGSKGYDGAMHTPDESKGAIEEIVESKNLLEAVFNTSTLGLHVLKSIRDAKGDIVDFDILLTNATSDRIAGRKVSGLRMLESWPHTREIGLFDKFVQVVETGVKLEYDHLYAGDGFRAWFQWIASRLNDGLYATIEDITERKKAEETLKTTAGRLQSTFDGAPAVIALLEVVLDNDAQPVDFLISAANKAMADLTGIKTSDLMGRKITDFYPEVFRDEIRETYLNVFKSGDPLHQEFLYPGLDRWFSIYTTKQVDGHGIVVAAIEITAQKKGEDQKRQNKLLAELNAAKTEFFSNVSHEFRTPLTLMRGPLQNMLKHFGENAAYTDHLPELQLVYRNTLRLEKLVNTLLNFSQIESGRSDAVFKPTDLAQYTTLLAGNFRSAIENAGLKFIVDCQSSEPIYVNHDMWEKIVLNLISNAFKFTFTGRIEVCLRSYKKHVKLLVRDTGIGILASNQSKIFERFTRIPNARSRSSEGTGIGLALVKELVNIHGGDIEVSSKEGEGTVFTVSIPKGKDHLTAKNIFVLNEPYRESPFVSIYADELMSWSTTESPMQSANYITPDNLPGQSKATILLVDDNADMREYVRSILSHDFIVATAQNGMKALELVTKGLMPDLILADLMMPEMDGYALFDKIKANVETAGIPFIMLSARASEEDRIEGMRYGVDDYMVKPFSSRELLAVINLRLKRVQK